MTKKVMTWLVVLPVRKNRTYSEEHSRCYMRSSYLNALEKRALGRGKGGTKQGREVGEMLAFRYLKGLELEKRIKSSASCQGID